MADGTPEVARIAQRVDAIVKEAITYGARAGGNGLADALVVVTAAHAVLVDALRDDKTLDDPLLLELVSMAQKIGLSIRKHGLVNPQET